MHTNISREPAVDIFKVEGASTTKMKATNSILLDYQCLPVILKCQSPYTPKDGVQSHATSVIILTK
jgi:hypothetical protein